MKTPNLPKHATPLLTAVALIAAINGFAVEATLPPIVGKNGALYAFCMTVPAAGTPLKIKALGADAAGYGKSIKSVKLLGHDGTLQWKQEADGLAVTCPAALPFATSIVFRIE